MSDVFRKKSFDRRINGWGELNPVFVCKLLNFPKPLLKVPPTDVLLILGQWSSPTLNNSKLNRTSASLNFKQCAMSQYLSLYLSSDITINSDVISDFGAITQCECCFFIRLGRVTQHEYKFSWNNKIDNYFLLPFSVCVFA